MPFLMPQLICLEAEFYGQDATLAMSISLVESKRTEYSGATGLPSPRFGGTLLETGAHDESLHDDRSGRSQRSR